MLAIYIILVVFLLLLVLWIRYQIGRFKLYKFASHYNGPKPLPLIGNALYFNCKLEDILDRLSDFVTNTNPTNRDPIKFWLGPVLVLVFRHPQHVEKILPLSKFSHKHNLYRFLKTFLGESVLTASGPKHRIIRHHLQPLLDVRFCAEALPIINGHIGVCIEIMQKFTTAEDTFDCQHFVHNCCTDIIGEIILGLKLNSQQGENQEFYHAMVDVYDLMFARICKVWLQPNFLYKWTPYKKKQDQLYKTIVEVMEKSINEAWNRHKLRDFGDDFQPAVDRIAQMIMNHPEEINKDEFVNHLLTLYAASEDTIASIACFALLCFGMYPEYQQRAFEEIVQVFGSTPRSLTMDDLNQLPYLDMCLKDVLRLVPIGPYVIRQPLEDTKVDDWPIPKGCALMVPIFNLHRDANEWQEPYHFHPDHFLPDQIARRHTYSYVPFSAGARGCIGKTLANICLKAILVSCLQRFEIAANGKFPGLRLKQDISVRAVDGYNIRLKQRKW